MAEGQLAGLSTGQVMAVVHSMREHGGELYAGMRRFAEQNGVQPLVPHTVTSDIQTGQWKCSCGLLGSTRTKLGYVHARAIYADLRAAFDGPKVSEVPDHFLANGKQIDHAEKKARRTMYAHEFIEVGKRVARIPGTKLVVLAPGGITKPGVKYGNAAHTATKGNEIEVIWEPYPPKPKPVVRKPQPIHVATILAPRKRKIVFE